MPIDEGTVVLRAARPEDAETVATIWYDGWRDGHLGHVPDELAGVRTQQSFHERAAKHLGDTVLAVVDDDVAGFVMVVDDEIEQVYVAERFRGAGVAGSLLEVAERIVADYGYDRAWLAVVAGNTRARRFYERNGWVDEGPFQHQASHPSGPIPVSAHRYVKRVKPPG